ncbi:efflux RND transporter periplasmic adaptor subunit [Methylocystis silviterrae]|uniref:efflux RND transporter periplasmic adaptor subunit n=1 Tax=Methylocystis silviterrae TaxID=2743612 RepID=UPI003C765010
MSACVDGFIVEHPAAVGKRVTAGAPLFVIGDAKIIRLRAKASDDRAFAITPGAEAIVTSEAAPERAFLGKVSRCAGPRRRWRAQQLTS